LGEQPQKGYGIGGFGVQKVQPFLGFVVFNGFLQVAEKVLAELLELL